MKAREKALKSRREKIAEAAQKFADQGVYPCGGKGSVFGSEAARETKMTEQEPLRRKLLLKWQYLYLLLREISQLERQCGECPDTRDRDANWGDFTELWR